MDRAYPFLKHSGLEMTHIPSVDFLLVRTSHMAIAGLAGDWGMWAQVGSHRGDKSTWHQWSGMERRDGLEE